MAIFSIPIIVTGILLLLYGRAEQFFSLEEFRNALIPFNISDLLATNKNLCNFYYGMPFYAHMQENLNFTKCVYETRHVHSFQFYLLLSYFLLWLYFFFDFIKRNRLSLFWNFISIVPGLVVFLIACDTGRWVAFSILNMTVIIFYWSFIQKVYLNKIISIIIFFTFFLGTFNEWYSFSIFKISNLLNYIIISTPFLNDLYNLIFQ